MNSVQIRCTGTDGVQRTQLVEFPQSFDYSEQKLSLDRIVGVNDVSLVFMPGSRFDLDWFRFDR